MKNITIRNASIIVVILLILPIVFNSILITYKEKQIYRIADKSARRFNRTNTYCQLEKLDHFSETFIATQPIVTTVRYHLECSGDTPFKEKTLMIIKIRIPPYKYQYDQSNRNGRYSQFLDNGQCLLDNDINGKIICTNTKISLVIVINVNNTEEVGFAKQIFNEYIPIIQAEIQSYD